jgi:hypothetical protein
MRGSSENCSPFLFVFWLISLWVFYAISLLIIFGTVCAKSHLGKEVTKS